MTFQSRKLYKILNYMGGHLCKSPPSREDFLLVSTKTRNKYELDVCLKIKMHICVDDEEEETEDGIHYIKLFPQFIADIVKAKNGMYLASLQK